MTKKTEKFIATVGRRKTSTARVRLFEGKGQILVNSKPIDEYFKDVPVSVYLKPFILTKVEGKFYFTAVVSGGGSKGQADAINLAVSRALVKKNAEKYKKILKSQGLLTRDPREKERRKAGLAQKARAGKQSPKR